MSDANPGAVARIPADALPGAGADEADVIKQAQPVVGTPTGAFVSAGNAGGGRDAGGRDGDESSGDRAA